MNDLNLSTCNVDIRLDDSSHVRILPVRDVQHCKDLSEKSKIFLESKFQAFACWRIKYDW